MRCVRRVCLDGWRRWSAQLRVGNRIVRSGWHQLPILPRDLGLGSMRMGTMGSVERPRLDEREHRLRRTHPSHSRPNWVKPSQKGQNGKRGGDVPRSRCQPAKLRRHRTTTSLRKQKAGTPHPDHLVLRTRSNAADTPSSGV